MYRGYLTAMTPPSARPKRAAPHSPWGDRPCRESAAASAAATTRPSEYPEYYLVPLAQKCGTKSKVGFAQPQSPSPPSTSNSQVAQPVVLD